MRFVWQEREFPAVEKPTFGEIGYVEKLTGQAMDEWNSTLSTRAAIFWSMRRVDKDLMSWAALDDLGPDDFDILEEESDEVVVSDPPDSTSATGSGGPPAVAASSSSDEPGT